MTIIMPELPEVETLKLGLQKYIVGKTIESVEVIDPKLLTGDPKTIEGGKVLDVRRYAKGIVIDLDNKYSIAFHIKLTGQLIFRDDKTRNLLVMKPTPNKVPNKFTRVVIHFDDPSAHSVRSGLKIEKEEFKKIQDKLLFQIQAEKKAWL